MAEIEADKLVVELAQAIVDKKGMNIVALDVRGVSSMTDYFLVAEGNVERHVKAIANAVQAKLKEHGERPAYVEGLQMADWIVLDCWSVVVHIFTPEMRQRYQIERLWEEAKIVDLPLDLSMVGEEVDVL